MIWSPIVSRAIIFEWIDFFSDRELAGDDTALVESVVSDHPAWLPARRHRARLADARIAQSCIDHDVRLVAHDEFIRHFARVGRLRLAL